MLLVAATGFAQEGVLKGKLFDDYGEPLPGAVLQIKGTPKGTQTDFDGAYTLKCSVGDVLVITALGYATRELTVTAAMFREDGLEIDPLKKAVTPITQTDYEQAIKDHNPDFYAIPDLSTTPLRYTTNRKYLDVHRIKNVSKKDSILHLETYADEAFFEIGVSQHTALQYVPKSNLPELQQSYAQGRPEAGELTHRGPETGERFSYGPLLSSLAYDGSSYAYDVNGRPVPRDQVSGAPVTPYAQDIFENGWNTSTAVKLGVYYDVHRLNFNFANGTQRDLFDQGKETYNRINFGYENNNSFLSYSLSAGYSSSKTNNANLNGLHNQVYYSSLLTPPTFSNTQGIRLSDGTQRSFSPGNYNNPLWLLQTNANRLNEQAFNVQGTGTYLGEKFQLRVKTLYDTNTAGQEVGIAAGTAGFNNGLFTNKNFESEQLAAEAKAMWSDLYITDFLDFSPSATFQYTYSGLDFDFTETQSGEVLTDLNPSKTTIQMLNTLDAKADFYDFKLNLTLQQKLFTSSLQGNNWWLPDVILNADFRDIFYSDFLRRFKFTAAYSTNVNDLSLYYNNYGYNSLNLSLSESQQYTTNADLFNNAALTFEKQKGLDLSLTMWLWNQVTIDLNYYRSQTRDAIFPVFTEQAWKLLNTAELRDSGFEAGIKIDTYDYSVETDFRYTTAISFSTHNPVVRNLGTYEGTRLPVAGFGEVSQNLIAGQPLGVIMGTAYARDGQGNLRIGADGFPQIASEPKILGDPIPDFNLGWSNTLRYKKFLLKFTLDWQQGGDVWNGTQQALNYFGTSLESAQQRTITDYVFEGVAPDGTPNTQPVAFAPPDTPVTANRWVRYGYGGVAEASIADASFLNLQQLSLTYELKRKVSYFFKMLSISVYGNNLWNSAGFKGANPYSSLYGNPTGSALHYFNMPLAGELGIHLNIKI